MALMIFFQNDQMIAWIRLSLLLVLSGFALGFGQTKWTLVDAMPNCKGIASITFGNGLFVAVGDTSEGAPTSPPNSPQYPGFVATSDSAKIWTLRNVGQTQDLNSVAYGKNQFVAIGNNGYFLTSTNGITWTSLITGSTSFQNSIAYGNGRFIVVGEDPSMGGNYQGVALASTDGTNWTKTDLAINLADFVTYGNKLFVALGATRTIFPSTHVDTFKIISSADGIIWKNIYSAISSFDSFTNFHSIAYGDNQFVAVGNGRSIYSSTDGSSWTKRDLPGWVLTSITYGGGQFVAVGWAGYVFSSRDGISWAGTRMDTTKDYISVAYGNGQFVAVGKDGAIAISKADPVAVQSSHAAPVILHSLKIHLGKNRLTALLPNRAANDMVKVTLLNIAGETVLSSIAQVKNGMFSVSTEGAPSRRYVLLIAGTKSTVSASLVLLH